MFLLVQCGMSIVLIMATKFINAHVNGINGEVVISRPTLELAALIITNVLIVIFAVKIAGKGWKAPFQWRMPYSDNAPTKFRDENANFGNKYRDFQIAKTTVFAQPQSKKHSPYICPRRNMILLSLAGMVPLMFLVNTINELIDLPDLMSDTFYQMAFSPLALAALAIIGPIAEEFCFRYGLEGALLDDRRQSAGRRTMPVWVAITISAAVFGLIHANPAQMVGAFLFGMYFGALFAFTGSIWPSLLCHVLNNGVAVVVMRILPEDFTLTHALNDNALILMLTLLSLIILTLIIRGMIIVHHRAITRFSSTRKAED